MSPNLNNQSSRHSTTTPPLRSLTNDPKGIESLCPPLEAPSAIHGTDAGLIQKIAAQVLTHDEHLSVVISSEGATLLTVENRNRDIHSTARATEIENEIKRLLAFEDAITTPTVRLVHLPHVGALEQLGHLRALYLEYPEIASIDFETNCITLTPQRNESNIVGRNAKISSKLSGLYKCPFDIRYTEHGREGSLPNYQAMTLPLALLRSSLDHPTPPISTLIFDHTEGVIALETERALLSPQSKQKLIREACYLHPGLVMTLSEDPSMPGLTRFLTEVAPTEIEAFKIQREDSHYIIRVLLNEGEPEKIKALCSKLSALVNKATPSALRIEAVVNSCALAKRCFVELPHDWRYSGVTVSPQGDSAKVLSLKAVAPSLPEHILAEFRHQYPGGIFINQESLRTVAIDTPLRQSVFTTLPSRHIPSEVYECSVTGELTIRVASEPPKECLQELSERVERAIKIERAPSVFAAEPILPALRLIEKYAEKLPFFTKIDSNKVSFHGIGACQLIGGSCLALHLRGINVLLDCGAWLNEDKKVVLPPSFIQDTDFMVLSHLHTDHVGGLLEAVQLGYSKPILTTQATAVAMITILQEQAKRKGIPAGCIEQVYKLVRIVPYNEKIPVANNLTVAFYPAGHVVGSATVRLEHSDQNGDTFSVLYTGDYKFAPSRLHKPAVIPPPSDIVISEGTYGARDLPERSGVEAALINKLHTTLEAKGTAILPVLNFNRAQEVLSLLYENMGGIKERGADVLLVGGVIQRNQQYDWISRTSPFEFSESALRARPWQECTHTAISRPNAGGEYHPYLLRQGTPQVIVASGGMVVGPAEALVKHHCSQPNNSLLLTCYQAADTLGRKILDYRDGLIPEIEGLENFAMSVERFQISGHSSVHETSQFIGGALKPGGKVILVHGESGELEALEKHLLDNNIAAEVLLPELGVEYAWDNAQN